MPHPFLSDEWIAEARAIREQHGPRDASVPAITMNLTITEVPFGEGTVHSYLDTSSGSGVFELGQLETADVTLSTDYETARAMFALQDQAVAMQAFLGGKVLVQGDMMKLMAFNASVAADPAATVLAEQVKAITQ